MRDRPPLLRIDHLWVALPFSFVIWAGLNAPIRLIDFWVYLKLGEIIALHRAIPPVDLFSFTAAGKPFVLQGWLAPLGYHLTERVGGLELVVALNALLLACSLAFAFRSCLEEALRLRPAVAGAAFAASGLIFQRNMRPQTFSFLFFAVILWIGLRMRRQQRVPWWLAPAIMMIWVNCHGSFVLGIALIALVLVGDSIERKRLSRPLLVALLLMAVATLVNPEGPAIYRAVLEVASDRSSQLLVQEWLGPDIRELQSLLAFYVPLALVSAGLLFSRRRLSATEILMMVVFAAFAFTARRNAIWFNLVAAPVMAAHFSSIRVSSRGGFESGVLNSAIAALIVAITVLVSPWVYPRLGLPQLGTSLPDRRTPVGAVEFLARNEVRGRLFHPQEFGDYIIWKLWPMQRTFIDSRVHLFDDAVIDDYIRVGRVSDDWERILDRYAISWILLGPAEREHRRLLMAVSSSDRWHERYRDSRGVLFERSRER